MAVRLSSEALSMEKHFKQIPEEKQYQLVKKEKHLFSGLQSPESYACCGLLGIAVKRK